MRRAAAILLMLHFLALGTGVFEYLHNLQHEREDAEAAALSLDTGKPPAPEPVHDDSNCPVHTQLHLPTLPVAWVPLLVFIGVFVAYLTEIARPLVSQQALLRIDCRGPPAC